MSLNLYPIKSTFKIDYLTTACGIDAIFGECFPQREPGDKNPQIIKDMLIEYANNLLDWHAAYSPRRGVDRFGVIAKRLLPQFQKDVEVIEKISDHLMDFDNKVREFLGVDRWIMHFIQHDRVDMVVQKSIDYRIHRWMIEHADELAVCSKKL